ncbi:MAG: chromosomal replication initiator protein DnaA [Clostridia bacterium]|nr:chromosomal replication initiator protein DnaA [Clostridia bacterium]
MKRCDMMNDFSANINSSWNSVLSILKEEITEVGFKTWFEPLKPIKFENNKLFLLASNEIQKNTILMKHSDLLKNSVEIALGETADFEIVLKNQINDVTSEREKPAEKVFSSSLNPRYTFEEFVVGSNNNHAHAASLAVAENPGKAYNPLFLYSNAGLGKTHLMHSIGHYILAENPSAKVLYVTSEKFINDLINAIKDDKREEFRNSYRTVDVLLIDDIQFIAGKKGMQEEFFHTFNTLVESNRQIVITSDRHPREIQNLEERIRTRLESSLIVDIQPPDYETRVAILRKKAQKNNMGIPDEILDIIAKSIKSNIRELEGAIKRITLYCSMSNEPITKEYVMREMKDIIPNTEEIVTNKLVLDAVSRYFDIEKDELLSKKRTKEVAYVRQIAMYLCSNLVKSTLEDVGSFFGGRHHTTVMHDIKKIANEMKINDELKNTITDLTKNIKNEG